MTDIQPTLDLIDGALEDYLSPDAMRWTPDEDQRAEVNSDHHGNLGTYVADWMERFWREHEPPSVGSAFRRAELTDWQRDVIEDLYALPRGITTPSSLRLPGNARVWINDEEITGYIDSVTLNQPGPPRGVMTALPPHTTPPPDRDIIGNIRRLYEQMTPEYQVIAPPSFVEQHGQRPELAGIQVETSELVPEGQVYVINRRVGFDDWFRVNAIAAAAESLLLHGNVYIKPPIRNPHMRAIHAAYRHRQLARRRRNR